MTPHAIWEVLGVEATADVDAIRRAYARRLKQTNPEDDAEGFQALRQAYEIALAQARGRRSPAAPPPQPPSPPEPIAAPRPQEAPAQATPAWADMRVDEQAHAGLCNRVNALLAQPEAAEADLASAFAAVLASPALESLDVRQRTEAWASNLIQAHPRRTDPLIEAAIAAFGWGRGFAPNKTGLGVAAVRRRDDLDMLAQLKRRDDPRHEAFRALTTTPSTSLKLRYRVTIGLGRAVRSLLADLTQFHGGLMVELDPQAVTFWRGYFDKPQLNPVGLWCSLAAPVLVGLLALFGQDASRTTLWLQITAFVLAAVLGGQAAWVYGVARPRRAWQRRRQHAAGAIERFGWAPLSALALGLSAFSLQSPWIAWSSPLAAIAALLWSYVTGQIDRSPAIGWTWPRKRPGEWRPGLIILISLFIRPGAGLTWQVKAMFGNAYAFIFLVIALRVLPGALQASIALAAVAAMAAFTLSSFSLSQAWLRLGRIMRRALLITLAVLAAATPLALWLAPDRDAWVASGLVLILMLSLAQRPAATRLTPRAALIRDVLLRYGWLIWLAADAGLEIRSPSAAPLMAGLWLLTGVAATVAGALRMERALDLDEA